MNRLLALVLIAPLATLGASPENPAMKDANHLASCIRVLDVDCVVSLTYQPATQNGASAQSDVVKDIKDRYGNSDTGTRLAVFSLKDPTPEFSGDGKAYVFIPYTMVLVTPGVSAAEFQAFLIGISTDNGMTWKFVDNWRASEEAVRQVFPGYSGIPSLPKREVIIRH
jgi:hypothetical protein